jgi:DNA-binding CsgD family transcriptional regulator
MSDQVEPLHQARDQVPLIVARDRELALLRDQLAATRVGRGSLVLVGGEAGIGKTALVRALGSEAAGQGCLVLTGQCYDVSVAPPYGPWREALGTAGRLVDDLPLPTLVRDASGPLATARAETLLHDVWQFVVGLAGQRPLLLMLEDLHWADQESLDLLRYLARSADRHRLLLVATYRDDELTHAHPLADLLPVLVHESTVRRIVLHRLDAAATRVLTERHYVLPEDHRARLVAHLQTHAEGIPFYIWEVLRDLEDAGLLRSDGGAWSLGDLGAARLPPLARQVIERRLTRLGDGVRALLQVAAVIGQEVPVDLWLQVAGVPSGELDGAIDLAVDAYLLEMMPGGTRLRFHHALLREALYERVPPLHRRDLHRGAAEVLERGPRMDPSVVAHHFRQAGDPRAVTWLIRAAVQADRQYAWQAVAEQLLAAAELLEGSPDDDQRRGWLLYVAAERLRNTTPQHILAVIENAAGSARARGDRPLLLAAQRLRALLRCATGDIQRGLADYHAARALWQQLPAGERRQISQAISGPIAWLDGSTPPAPAGGEDQTASWIDTLDHAVFHGPFADPLARYGYLADAIAIGEEVLARLDADPAPSVWDAVAAARSSDWMDVLFGLGRVYALLGRLGDARRALAQARDAYHAVGHAMHEGATIIRELELVVLPYLTDNVKGRRRLARDAMSAWERARASLPPGESMRNPMLLLLPLEGDWDAATALATAACAGGHQSWRPIATCLLAALARRRGARDRAWDLIHEYLPDGPETVPGSIDWYYAVDLQRVGVALALDASDLEMARAWLLAHDDWLAWSGAVLGQADGQLLWARFHHTTGDLTRARQHAQRALVLAGDPRQPLALLAAQRLLGRLDTEAGRHAAAEQYLTASLALAVACAAPYERALTLLALAGLRAATGDGEEARVHLGEARAICVPLGAAPVLAECDALERRLAAQATPPARAYPAGLSAREVEILRLIATGRSNREIAADLAISPRTTERHITNIYTKLNATTRAEAIAFAHRHQLT